MLKIVNAFLKEHRKELGLKGYSKMSYLQKLDYLKEKTKGTKYEREIGKLTKPRVDEGIKKVLEKSGRGKNVRVKKDKEKIKRQKFEKAVKDLKKRVPPKPKMEPKTEPEKPKWKAFESDFEKAKKSKTKLQVGVKNFQPDFLMLDYDELFKYIESRGAIVSENQKKEYLTHLDFLKSNKDPVITANFEEKPKTFILGFGDAIDANRNANKFRFKKSKKD